MQAVENGVTETQMRVAFENARAGLSARVRPSKNKRSLAGRIARHLDRTNAGRVRHKKMAYVTRPLMMFNGRLVTQ